MAAETGYLQSGIHVTNFVQIVAERLAQEDPNWGRRINDTGPLGNGTVAIRSTARTIIRTVSSLSLARQAQTQRFTGASTVPSAGF